MDILLLGITVISLAVALVMSIAAWRVMRDEKKRSAARVAALSLAAGIGDDSSRHESPVHQGPGRDLSPRESFPLESFAAEAVAPAPHPATKAPWAPAPINNSTDFAAKSASVGAGDMPLNQTRPEAPVAAGPPVRFEAPLSHASGFLGAQETPRDTGRSAPHQSGTRSYAI